MTSSSQSRGSVLSRESSHALAGFRTRGALPDPGRGGALLTLAIGALTALVVVRRLRP